MRPIFNTIGAGLYFIFLTLLTQVGGLVWLAALGIHRSLGSARKFPFRRSFIFIALYLIVSIFLLPVLAVFSGRVPLPVFSNRYLKPENIMFCLFNRHYVRPELKKALESAAFTVAGDDPAACVRYLDACFPLFNGYPLEPHFSHKDGKKTDIVFYWKHAADGSPVKGSPSFYGYGIFAEPLPGEYDYAAVCEKKGYWYIGLDGWIAGLFCRKQNYVFDSERTRKLAVALAEEPAVGKILIQPHLEKRLDIAGYDKFRQQGCQAARHDDHFHVELR